MNDCLAAILEDHLEYIHLWDKPDEIKELILSNPKFIKQFQRKLDEYNLKNNPKVDCIIIVDSEHMNVAIINGVELETYRVLESDKTFNVEIKYGDTSKNGFYINGAKMTLDDLKRIGFPIDSKLIKENIGLFLEIEDDMYFEIEELEKIVELCGAKNMEVLYDWILYGLEETSVVFGSEDVKHHYDFIKKYNIPIEIRSKHDCGLSNEFKIRGLYDFVKECEDHIEHHYDVLKREDDPDYSDIIKKYFKSIDEIKIAIHCLNDGNEQILEEFLVGTMTKGAS